MATDRNGRLAEALASLVGVEAVQQTWWECGIGHVLATYTWAEAGQRRCTFRFVGGRQCPCPVTPIVRPMDLTDPALGLPVLERFLRERGGTVFVDVRTDDGFMAFVRDGRAVRLGQAFGQPTLWDAVLAAWERALGLAPAASEEEEEGDA